MDSTWFPIPFDDAKASFPRDNFKCTTSNSVSNCKAFQFFPLCSSSLGPF